MPRIGRQIPHFELVDLHSIEAVFSSDMRYRYSLILSYLPALLDRKRDKNVVVILKNPSAADKQKADATIRKVETFVYHHFEDAIQLHILNIFAFRATEPCDLNEAYTAEGAMSVIGEENDQVIRKALVDSDYVVLAWGNNSGIDKVLYEERIFRVKQLLQEIPRQKIFLVEGNRKTKHPLHGLMWGYDYKIKEVGKYLDHT